MFPHDCNLVSPQPDQDSQPYCDSIRQAKYCAGAALELLDEAERLGRDHAKYDRLLLQAGEIVHIAHSEFFWSEHEYDQPLIEARARRRTGSQGGKGKSAKYEPLRKAACERYDARTWETPSHAASAMMPELLKLPEAIHCGLCEKLVYKWVLRHSKSVPQK